MNSDKNYIYWSFIRDVRTAEKKEIEKAFKIERDVFAMDRHNYKLFDKYIGYSEIELANKKLYFKNFFPLNNFPDLKRNGPEGNIKINSLNLGTLAETLSMFEEIKNNNNVLYYKYKKISDTTMYEYKKSLMARGIKPNEDLVIDVLKKSCRFLRERGYELKEIVF